MYPQQQINRFSTPNELSAAVSERIVRLAKEAEADKGCFYIAISGGSLLDIICPPLVSNPLREAVNWSAWHVFWADERWVPLDSPESNFGGARQKLFSAVSIPQTQIHTVDNTFSPSETARRYQATLEEVLHPMPGKLPRFDLILLGIGEDGHTASLFPGHPLLKETRRLIAHVNDAPKPPPVRITMTLPVINNAGNVFFVAMGAGKVPIITRIIGSDQRNEKLPAELVQPCDGELSWFFSDKGFSKSLTR